MNFLLALCLLLGIAACNQIDPKNDPITFGDGYLDVQLSTDKAAYMPGEQVTFTLNKLVGAGSASVRYRHLGTTLAEEPLTSLTWSWQPPSEDFQGYMIDIHAAIDGKDSIFASVAVDVSSEASRYPRNGFLSAYGKMSQKEIDAVIGQLNRYHINYLQFQDWHYKHHHPLAGTITLPLDEWTDIISRTCYRTTVENYISTAHNAGMKCLFYNLAYGALDDAQEDGVSPEWYLYTDRLHQAPDFHPLGSPFKSSIYITNPGNTQWQDYLVERNNEVYGVFDFDGYQIDQLGTRGDVYDYNGNSIDLKSGFGPFIERMKTAHPDKRLVMNAVGQYGQQYDIAPKPVDFLYTEVWDKNPDYGYDILRGILADNYNWSGGKRTVLAAYMDYDHGSKGRGYFNTHGVLMTTAVAHVWGGTILQLGEHMLCNEYFPDDNLTMRGELKIAMLRYYDFITAYENLLRDGEDWFGANCQSEQLSLNQWPPQRGKVSTIGKHVGNADVIHLLNYVGATHLDWSDTDADQTEPQIFHDITISIERTTEPAHVYVATPDINCGVMQEVEFSHSAGKLTLTVPYLHYWTMLVIE